MHWYQCIYLIITFQKSLKLFDIKVKLLHSMYSQHQLNINCGMYFKVQIYLDGLLMLVTSHKNLVVDNLRTMIRHFGWVFNIPYSIMYKECQSTIYYNTNVTITVFMHMWKDMPKGVLYMHSLKTHFSSQFVSYINAPIKNVFNIAKGWTVCFHSGLLLEPAWHPWVFW